MDLFSTKTRVHTPLAERMRPKTLDDFIGQEHLTDDGKIIKELIQKERIPSLIFWGPPGSGKTTLARIIANHTKSNFIETSAVTSGVADVKRVVEDARAQLEMFGTQTILFIDEIHRYNKAQQDALLPHVERGTITLIGATTENPSFEVISPLLSRSRVVVLKQHTEEHLKSILEKTIAQDEILITSGKKVTPEAIEILVQYSNGDARRALTTLEVAFDLAKTTVGKDEVEESLQQSTLRYDKTGDEHYDTISAFIKSLRDSDPDGGLYYLARMLEAGEDPIFIARRMVVLASEDIGNADAQALSLALAVFEACEKIGMPECRINLAQGVTYLATASKSNASYMGIEQALAEVRESGNLPIPMHIRNTPTKLMKELGYHKGYKYAHDFPDSALEQQHLPDKLVGRKFYQPKKGGK
ncbi:MAG: AAA family ATPase [Candidatus Woykebacteria bacterium RIFCSPHIGHO2_02_FULL_43_16b]|uniref:AAA family ATPase n=1 Tax=Candidatus Woykebacteria bacterium RIFCSPHIGHO2_02_FULL_43_16b TaxID=1802601 RepID=A0A1G1WQD1_9BACT|nr:MAG: AAA family ATPase [Candidatus Woykebacteria bacterium RIFCSPHIGHO2_02_FULL_43_16b]